MVFCISSSSVLTRLAPKLAWLNMRRPTAEAPNPKPTAPATRTPIIKTTSAATLAVRRTLTAGLPSSIDCRSKCLPSGGRIAAKGSSNLGAATGAATGGGGAKGIGGGGGGASGLGMALGPGTGPGGTPGRGGATAGPLARPSRALRSAMSLPGLGFFGCSKAYLRAGWLWDCLSGSPARLAQDISEVRRDLSSIDLPGRDHDLPRSLGYSL